jgi:WD40 repeat protein
MKRPAAMLEARGAVVLDDFVAEIAWSTDGTRLAVAGGEGKVFLVDRVAGAGPKALAAREVGEHPLGTLSVAWQPRGAAFVSCGQDGALVLHDGEDGRPTARQRPPARGLSSVAWSPDGRWFASAAGKQIFLWTPALEPAHALPPLDTVIASLGWDRAGRDLAAAVNGGVVAHRIEPPQFEMRRYPWNAPCLTAAYSPNGKALVTGTQDGSVHFWYLATGRDSQMRGYPGKVDVTVWSGDSRWLATIADSQVVVWDFGGRGPEGSRPLQLSGHTDRIDCLAFQPNGNFLVSAGRDWRLSLWLPGKTPGALDAHLADAEPSALRWSPDGRFVALGERRGRLSIYELVRLG